MINAVNRGVLTAVCALLNLILVRHGLFSVCYHHSHTLNLSSWFSQEHSTSSSVSRLVASVSIRGSSLLDSLFWSTNFPSLHEQCIGNVWVFWWLLIFIELIGYGRLNSRQHVAKKAYSGKNADWNLMTMAAISNNNVASSADNYGDHVRVVVTKQTANDSGYVSVTLTLRRVKWRLKIN